MKSSGKGMLGVSRRLRTTRSQMVITVLGMKQLEVQRTRI